MRREGPLAVTIISGLLFILGKFFNVPFLTNINSKLNDWYLIVKAVIVFVGIIGLTLIHWQKVAQRRNDWIYSAMILGSMYIYMFYGLFTSLSDPAFSNIYNKVVAIMTQSLFSTLMFFLGSAAYRAFRVRTFEASILLISAIVIMIGNVTLGEAISPILPQAASWIMKIPTAAGMRAIGMSAAIGGIVTALKIMLGLERSYLGS